MKETNFCFLISIRTLAGPEDRGRINIGNDRKIAEELFNGLCGDKLPQEEDMLIIQLVEIVNDQPVKLGSLGCSLEELCENCKSIIKHLFMQLNLAPTY